MLRGSSWQRGSWSLKPSMSVFQNLLFSGCGDTLSLCPGLTGESVFTKYVCMCVGLCVFVCVFGVYVACLRKIPSLNVYLSLLALSPGMFWPWMAATGNALTSLTFRGTLR